MKQKSQLFEIFNEQSNSVVVFKNKALKKMIINYLDSNDNQSITEISKETNASVPKTTSLINELIKDGLVMDFGKLDSSIGRKANVYGLVPESCYSLGVDVKKFSIHFGLLDFKKTLVKTKEINNFKLENSETSLNLLIKYIKDFIKEIKISKEKILGLGLNLSGRINHISGYSYSYFHFHEDPLSEIIKREIGITTIINNDSRAMAYGEYNSGGLPHGKNILFINIDYGIGLGIIIDGKLYHGKSGFSGEFGHMPFFENEILCHCGKKGCLETEASGSSLIRKLTEKIKKGSNSIIIKNKKIDQVSLQDIVNATLNDDVLCIELIAGIGEKLGKGIAVLINIFNPELIVLGGTLALTGDYIKLPIKSAINKYSLSLVNNDTDVRISKMGEKAGIIGACLLVRNKFLSN